MKIFLCFCDNYTMQLNAMGKLLRFSWDATKQFLLQILVF
jgi:hypothetical protein